jgi:hypothetical protein
MTGVRFVGRCVAGFRMTVEVGGDGTAARKAVIG